MKTVFKNRYTGYLYEYLLAASDQQPDGSKMSVIKVEDIKDVFNFTDGQYTKEKNGKIIYNYFGIERSVIVPAIEEINNNSECNMNIAYWQKLKQKALRGKRVYAYEIGFNNSELNKPAIDEKSKK